MSFLKKDNPYNPKKDRQWEEMTNNIHDISIKVAEDLGLPASTREISALVIMNQHSPVIDEMNDIGLDGTDMYKTLCLTYETYLKYGMPFENMPSSLMALMDFKNILKQSENDSADPVTTKLKQEQDPSKNLNAVQVDGYLSLIFNETHKNIIELKVQDHPDEVRQEVYNGMMFSCLMDIILPEKIEGEYNPSVTFGNNSILTLYVFPDGDLHLSILEYHDVIDNTVGKYEENTQDAVKKGKNKDKDKKKETTKKKVDKNAQLGGNESTDGLSNGPSPTQPS